MNALNLAGLLAQAESLEQQAPHTAAEHFGAVAEGLYEAGFTGHASVIKARQASALRAAGDAESAFDIWFDLVRNDLEAGELRPLTSATDSLRQVLENVSVTRKARFAALDALDDWYEGSNIALSALAKSAEQLNRLRDPFAMVATLWAAEAAVVDEDIPAQTAVLPLMEELLRHGPESPQLVNAGTNQELEVRLRCVHADVSGDWDELVTLADNGRIPSFLTALVYARRGR